MGFKIDFKYAILGLCILVIGFFAGRCTDNPKPKVEYIKGETVHDSIPVEKLVPYRVEIPAKPVLPMKPDTIKIPGKPEYIVSVVDTAHIIAEFIKKNNYNPTLFDNQTQGKLTLDLAIQYNKLSGLKYEFTPIQRQETIIQRRVFTPYITTSYNTLGYYGAGGGIYYYNLGFGAKYLTNFNLKGYEFSINYKF